MDSSVEDDIYAATSGTTLDVPVSMRHLALGADLIYYYALETNTKYVISSGISDMALPLYKKLRFHILSFPRMMLLCNARSIIESKGLSGLPLKILAGLINVPIKIFLSFLRWKSKNLLARFKVVRTTKIPNWVDDITVRDGHKYMEVHDCNWLQWNLDYNFKGDKNDIQSFYCIYKRNKPIGFFMTKERYRENAGGKLKNIVLGAIVEWGFYPHCELNEEIIYKMALSTFSKNVDIIEFASADVDTCKKMKNFGFIKHGDANIALKDKTKKCKDASNIDLWRIRYGYADVILT